jgi:hypothetical protein
MSGRKQHNIPKSLLRGFEIHPRSGRIPKVWLFRKGQLPCINSAEDAAAERHFYSEPTADGSETLDDRITSYENRRFSRLLSSLRALTPGAAVDPREAAEVIAHLTARNAHLRATFRSTLTVLIAETGSFFADEANLRLLFGADAPSPNATVQELIDRAIPLRPLSGLTGIPSEVLCQIVFTLMKENFSTLYAEIGPAIRAHFDAFEKNARASVREGHNRALGKHLNPEKPAGILHTLSWITSDAPPGGVILPDCVALGFDVENQSALPYLMTANDRLGCVLMPLSERQLLIGQRPGISLPDLRSFNEAAASCSHDFFVSASNSLDRMSLLELIGEQSRRFVADATSEILRGFRAEYLQVGADEPAERASVTMPDVADSTADETAAEGPTAYSLDFLHCADEATAAEIGSAVDAVVSEIGRLLPLSRLDGITFAKDYALALRDLDRGFPSVSSLVPTDDGAGAGVAMAPIVLRESTVKTRVVCQGSIGYALISRDDRARSLAIHVLVHQLAHVACVELVERALPGVSLGRINDEYEAKLYEQTGAAWAGYFAWRISAAFDPSLGESYRHMLSATVARAQETVPNARFTYRFDRDLGSLLETAISSAGAIIKYSACLLGYSDGLSVPPFEKKDPLADQLERAGLRGWFDSFHVDLKKVHECTGRWASAQEFIALNRHVERVLWVFGLFPWRTPEGLVRVEVPLTTDAARLLEAVNGSKVFPVA